MGIIRTNDLHKKNQELWLHHILLLRLDLAKGHVLVRPNDVGRWQSLLDMALGVNTELAYYKDEQEDNDKVHMQWRRSKRICSTPIMVQTICSVPCIKRYLC